MSDAREIQRIMNMPAIELLYYVCRNPEYLSDSYYSAFGKAIAERINELSDAAEEKSK